MRLFVVDYDQDTLTQVTDDQEKLMLMNFDRDCHVVKPEHQIEYFTINNHLSYSQQVIDLCYDKRLLTIIHQDSERELFILID